jgi:hypothetical protein
MSNKKSSNFLKGKVGRTILKSRKGKLIERIGKKRISALFAIFALLVTAGGIGSYAFISESGMFASADNITTLSVKAFCQGTGEERNYLTEIQSLSEDGSKINYILSVDEQGNTFTTPFIREIHMKGMANIIIKDDHGNMLANKKTQLNQSEITVILKTDCEGD